ncbi:MAG: pyrroloquinoline quinone-dependent dehydrogenase [Geminicoccaceae bacterium]
MPTGARSLGRRALPIALALLLAAPADGRAQPGQWLRYGLNDGGTRYLRGGEITPDNVARLEVAWTYHTGDLGEGFRSAAKLAFEATPILADGRLYLSTPFNQVIALDPASGREIWRFDARLDPEMNFSAATSRGVSWWADEAAAPDAPCATRIFLGTLDGRLSALDARTGVPCPGFGDDGQVDLTRGIHLREPGQYQITSPPAIFEDLVIVGSAIGDHRAVGLEYGTVRALDARSGALRWHFDPIPRDRSDPARAGWSAKGLQSGAANVWPPISVDAERGLVFLPTGSASPDFFGGERPGDNLYANSLVALDARIGAVVWHQQLVRHDIWDFDLPAQPVLADLRRNGEVVPAVIQATKMGMLFTFHRETGAPIFELVERAVPASDVPGEVAAATQPFPVAPPPLAAQGPLTPEDAWGLTFVDRWLCRREIAQLRSEGIYTPPSLEGTIMLPSDAGGSNWGGLAFDADRQLAFANVTNVAMVVRLIPRAEVAANASTSGDLHGLGAQRGTPYAVRREILFSPFGIPCNPPPWGTLAAVDMSTGEIRWQVPLGTTRDLAPWPWLSLGMPNLGGPIATDTGLVFVAAATDNYLRAFSSGTGAELWRGRLPAGGQATPMSYVLGDRQYVVIAAGGHAALGTTRGDAVVAFALPD